MREGRDATVQLETGDRRRVRIELETLRFRVLEGREAGRVWTLGHPLIRIGSASDNDIVLTDDGISRHHAELRTSPAGTILRDLGSTNGTFLAGVRVHEAPLDPGQECRFAGTRVLVERHREGRVVPVGDEEGLGALVGRSQAMRDLYGFVRALGPSPVTVLIRGETGTGKELVARELHARSGRPGRLVVFDAGLSDREMMRADLFGHLKGAFTGAESNRPGRFREADGGTLFLDEIGEIPLELQPRLLRAIENREVSPVGADLPVRVDVRIVAATHRDLPAMVAAGRFREDLYHRLAVVTLDVPPLRERKQDILPIARALARDLAGGLEFSARAQDALVRHDWRGNVRALRNAVERAGALVRGRPVEPEDLGLTPEPPVPATGASAPAPIRDLEREAIESALARTGGNKAQAARELGISVSTLRRRLKAFSIEA